MASSLAERFVETAGRYCADAALCEGLAAELAACYGESGRHYHTGEHIAFMLAELSPLVSALRDPDAVFFALCYHDAVYDPERADNEARSAEMAADRLARLGVPGARIDAVCRMILATRDHADTGDDDADALLDADLAALGQERAAYLRMAAAIRREYGCYDDDVWRTGRWRVLESFLAREHIYKTPHFRARYERQARENLQYEQGMLAPVGGFGV